MSKFSFETIKDFDKHISKSIPSYSTLIKVIENISTYFIRDGYNVYDLGCSTGTLLKRLHSRDDSKAIFIGLDISTNLLPVYEKVDNKKGIDYSKRLTILKNVYKSLVKGGALIITEKIFLENSKLQDIFTFSLYDYKKEYFTAVDILNKQKDLRRIMFPITEKENIELFKEAGF